MKKPFKSLADAKRRVEQGVSIDFTHLSEPTLNGPTRVIMWERAGFAIGARLRESEAGYFVQWPAKASDFDPKTGTIFKDGKAHLIIQLRD